MATEPEQVEYLYAIATGVADDSRFDTGPHVVRFRITRKTSRRIYYVRAERGHQRPDGTWCPVTEIGYIDRQAIERDGEIRRRSAGWWEVDGTLYLRPPELPDQTPRPDLGELKAAMAAAHPDRGGTDAEFIAARARYENARDGAR